MKYGPHPVQTHKKNSRRKKLQNSASLRLPIELIRPIVEFVSERASLRALLLTSSEFRIEAERVLYHSMKDEDRKTQMGFLKTTMHNPICAAHVRIYHAPVGRIDQYNSLWRRLAAAMKLMCNLKELTIQNLCSSLFLDMDRIAFPFKLDHFQCRITSDYDHKRLRHFISKQPQLRKINVDMFHDDPRYIEFFPSDITPNLSLLRGPLETMAAFLPGRSISMLSWETNTSDFSPDYLSVITTLSPYFGQLKYLSFGPPEPSLDDEESLITISQYFTSLEYLDLIGIRKHDIEALRGIPSLKGVTISMGRGSVLVLPRSTVSKIFAAAPRLKFVAIEQLSGRRGKRVFKRWENPQTSPLTPSIITIERSTFFHIFELLPF